MKKRKLLRKVFALLYHDDGSADSIGQESLTCLVNLIRKEIDREVKCGRMVVERLENKFPVQIDGKNWLEWLPKERRAKC